ncbi:MAG: response regulator [Coriobacteriales bacterium]|nr:response regulator [Coriobacteriales bacterium]
MTKAEEGTTTKENIEAMGLQELRKLYADTSKQLKKARRENKLLNDRLARIDSLSSSRDSLARMLQGEQARQSSFMNMLLDYASDIIVLLDNRLRVAFCSKRFLDLLGLKSSTQLEGRKIGELRDLLESRELAEGILSKAREALHTKSTVSTNMSARPGHGPYKGKKLEINVTIRVVHDSDNKISGVIMIGHDITDINEAKLQAELANRTKTEFLANISHELRTPLNAVNGLAELELHKDLPKDTLSNLEKIYGSGVTLLNIINDILDISKIDSGKFVLTPTDYDIASVISDTVSMNIVRIGSKPIKLQLQIDPDLPHRLYGDELRVKQIMNNLLSNAIKYTPEGTVTLSLSVKRMEKDCWLFGSVQDTGIGIRREDMPNLFAEYQRFDTGKNRKIEGTGLGLHLTKQLVNMMDGVIHVASKYGEGSTFSFKVRQAVIDDEPIGEKLANDLQGFKMFDDPSHRITMIDYVPMEFANILLVDDVVTNLDVAKGMLEPYKATVHSVTSGQQAIDRVLNSHTKYDIILMDHMMPRMDGIEATQKIRAIGTEYARNVPIVALTANAVTGIKELFLDNGCQDFLTKPIEVEELDRVMHTWVLDKQPKDVRDKALRDVEKYDKARDISEQDAIQLLKDAQIDGLDVDDGVARFSQNANVYMRVVHSFIHNMPNMLVELGRVNEGTLPDYSIVVHGAKGSCYGIGAKAAGDAAYELEVAAKADDWETVNEKNHKLIMQIKKLIVDLKVLEKHFDAEQHKNGEARKTTDAPNEELLDKLREAAENYDIETMQRVMDELKAYDYKDGTDLIEWLDGQVSSFDYDSIIERLEK